MFITRVVPPALRAVLCFLAACSFALAAPPGATQRWKGIIEVPGAKIDFGVTLMPGEDGKPATGTIDIPVQNVNAMALSDVVVTAAELKFTLKVAGQPANAIPVFSATPTADGAKATGELHQAGMNFPIRMERLAEGEAGDIGPKRPQEPKPPYPYTRREVTYTNAKDGTKLAATLTIPEGKGPFPAAVMITGSGAQDRDETLMGHKPFLVIADYLTRRGIAVLRADDRGVGGSTGNVADATAEDSVGDVLAGVALLKALPEIDGAHIGVIGHSEGGIIGPMAAAASKDVSFVVMLAGTGLKGRDILTMQSAAILEAAGLDKAAIAAATEKHKALMDAIEANAPREEQERAMRELAAAQQAAGGSPPIPEAEMNALVKQQLGSLGTPWFRSFLLMDPRVTLRKVRVPVLALNGSLDVQVPAKENLPEIEKALKEAGNTDVTARELAGLNHLFQTATTGGPSEYAAIEETFSPGVLEIMGEWILARTGRAEQDPK